MNIKKSMFGDPAPNYSSEVAEKRDKGHYNIADGMMYGQSGATLAEYALVTIVAGLAANPEYFKELIASSWHEQIVKDASKIVRAIWTLPEEIVK